MNKQFVQAILLVTTLVMVVTLLAGCKGDGASLDTSDNNLSTQPIEKLDFDGYEITFAGGTYLPDPNSDSALTAQWRDDITALEDRINAKFVRADNLDLKMENLLTQSLAGEKLADVIRTRQEQFFAAAVQNLILPVDGDQLIGYGLDCFDDTRWVQAQGTLSASLNGHYWSLHIAGEYIDMPSGYYVIYNPILCAEIGYSDMPQLIRDHKWTWDVYVEIAEGVGKDTTGDGEYDIWGTGATAWGVEILCNDTAMVGVDANGKYVSMFSYPNTMEGLDFLVKMNYTFSRNTGSSGDARRAFANGKVAFTWANISQLGSGSEILESMFDFGVAPCPLGPKATKYVSPMPNRDNMIFQACNKDMDTVIPILNEWASVFNNDRWIDRYDIDRFRTQDNFNIFMEYIYPGYIVHEGNMSPVVNTYCNSMVGLVSYYGESPAAVVEDYDSELQTAIDAFLEQ